MLISWRHESCGHIQYVPREGGEVECEQCGDVVLLSPKSSGQDKPKKIVQQTLGGPSIVLSESSKEHEIEFYRLNPRRQLPSLFKGYTKLRMVMYVQRVDFILDIFESGDVEYAQIVVGDSVVKSDRSRSEAEVFLRLADLIKEGRLEIRVPKKKVSFHEKWILAEKDGEFADIFGTANLTAQGSGKTGKQSNQQRVIKVTGNYEDSTHYRKCEDQFKWYIENSEVYLDDLVNLIDLDTDDENPAIEVVEKWITYTGAKTSGDTRKVQAIVQQFQEMAVNDSLDPDTIVTTIETRASDAVLDEVVKVLSPFGVQREGRQLIATTRSFLQSRVATFPIMTVIDGKIVLQVGEESVIRTADEYDSEAIRNGIHSIHQYVDTINRANVKNPLIAKKTIYEIILYFLSSPFHHYFMQQAKKEFGWHYNRGPKPLAIYGNTKNGKTFLLKYCSKLLTGTNKIKPFTDDDFTVGKIKNLLTWSSLFPVIVDDISDNKWGKSYMDQIGRSYWDNWWSNSRHHSQMIVTSNRRVPQGQLKGRIKEVVMDARFEDKTENIKHVSDILNGENEIFKYFSKRYLEIIETDPGYFNHLDCMHVARRVLSDLYEMAGIIKPNFFPNLPIEDVMDNNALAWLTLFNEGDAQWTKSPQGELKITFTNEEDKNEVRRYMDLIPEGLGPKRSGTMIRIPSPAEFAAWLNQSKSSFEVRRISRNLKRLLKH